jgi:quinoprotein glucose dehydrogenase
MSLLARSLGFAALLAFISSALWSQTDWPVYGHDPGGMRYSPLKQIDTKNAAKLQLVWKYDTNVDAAPADPPAGQGAPRRNFARLSETTPLVIGNVMYMSTSFSRVVALDSATGAEIWKYQSPGIPAYRGIAYWPCEKQSPPQIVFGTTDGFLISLNLKNGQPVPDSAMQGVVNLRPGCRYPGTWDIW